MNYKLLSFFIIVVMLFGLSAHACNNYICGMIMYSPNMSAKQVCKIYKNKEMYNACIDLYPEAEIAYKNGQCRKLSFVEAIKTIRILKNFK